MRSLIGSRKKTVSEKDILEIHNLILKGLDDNHAGHYRSVSVRISGSQVILPNPMKVPDLMEGFSKWLKRSCEINPVELAGEAHYRLVTIHPFVDGNGRTARLLMNLILLLHGYPPAIIRKRDRLPYIKSLEKAQLGGSKTDYQTLIAKAVDRSLEIYLKAIRKEDSKELPVEKLMKIGALAKEVDETVRTIRYWTEQGLLAIDGTTASNYALYHPDSITRVHQIQELKKEGFTLKGIHQKLSQ